MLYPSNFDLSVFQPVNYLWPQLVDKLGVEKAQHAVRQALDLQRMNGSLRTLPVLLFETCGLALVNIDLIRKNTGFPCHGNNMILILSTKEQSFQLLHET